MHSFKGVRQTAQRIARLEATERTNALESFAGLVIDHQDALVAAGAADLAEHQSALSKAECAKLTLDAAKIQQVVAGIRQVAALPDPIGALQQRTLLDDGLVLERVSVPLGVIGIIFESRADVAPQILSLALRSGNGVVLKGGSESRRINAMYAKIAAEIPGIPGGWFQLHHERDVVDSMLVAQSDIDLLIPRGSNRLVQSILERSRVPVLGHADGVCHLYVHSSADLAQAIAVVLDAKTQYPAACNAVETVLVDSAIVAEFLPVLAAETRRASVELRGSAEVQAYLPDVALVGDDDWHTEYGDLVLAVRCVDSLDTALAHIDSFGSHHTDGILARDEAAIEKFLNAVDSANVYANCSTRFADGFRYGFGAEVGISTARVHARGPVGIEGLLTYKYVLRGSGQCVGEYVGDGARRFQHKRLL